MSREPSPRTLYRRWYAAAGPWAGFFRAVPLVALARGVPGLEGWVLAGRVEDGGAGYAFPLMRTGEAEGWLGRPDVLLFLDLPGPISLAVARWLAPFRVRPVLLLLGWPEPGALLSRAALVYLLRESAPPYERPGRRRSTNYQYAFVLERERAAMATPADLATRFDNRYTLGSIDLPSVEQLAGRGVQAVVAYARGNVPPAPDLNTYLDGLTTAGVPVRRLTVDYPLGPYCHAQDPR
jgi:hypothetical protein